MSSIWAKGFMLTIVCVLSDLTRVPLLGGRRKLWYIIITVRNTIKYCWTVCSAMKKRKWRQIKGDVRRAVVCGW